MSRLRELPTEILLSSAAVMLRNKQTTDVDVAYVIDALSEVVRDEHSSPQRRSYVLEIVSALGLRGVESLCLNVSGARNLMNSQRADETLRTCVTHMCDFFKEEDEYPGYLDVLSGLSFSHLVSECERVGTIRYAQTLLYGYAPLLPHLKSFELRKRVADIQDMVSFS